eukprot:CAMPEP_0117757458 /NCGR_PEP_ID=MMETSP0947-20121206/14751_1 /TAXON_ID=44440 /ORGANISM="Chattonella subsalsa, Strain CCMP2191" /LENGTH=264 /DNA_ID=CAMNT_0005577371 /DNA_START=50 /DNA_END=844 /DNA_ORIENTATION=+
MTAVFRGLILLLLLADYWQCYCFMIPRCTALAKASRVDMSLESKAEAKISRQAFLKYSVAFFGLGAFVNEKNALAESVEFNRIDTATESSLSLEEQYKVTSKCFFDLSIGGKPAGRIVISLFGEDVPETVENFEALVTGSPGYGYKGTNFYRVIEGFTLQAGAIGDNTGRSGKSSSGSLFGPENFNIPHSEVGVVSMARALDGKNDSRFFIQTQADAGWANGKYVAFGKVTDGLPLVEKIEKLKTKPPQNNPIEKVIIEDCGKL